MSQSTFKSMRVDGTVKRFNLLKKSDRIALFQGVLYHNRPLPDLPPLPMFKPAPVDSN